MEMAQAGTLVRNFGFVWEELLTSDLAAERDFYEAVLGWTHIEQPVDGGGSYTMFQTGGDPFAGAWQTDDGPTSWSCYIGVQNVDEAVEAATQLGATIMREPFDVMDMGRMATLVDPTGAIVNVWQSTGAEDGAPGATPIDWRELRTTDVAKALTFYTGWLGWKSEGKDMGGFTYHLLSHDGTDVAGLMELTPAMKVPEMGEHRSHWRVIFAVDNVDAAYTTATERGAKTLMEPGDIPRGRYAELLDPKHANFGIVQRPA
jgi:predicted enzyme related to lactoylglutathione lyase